MNQKKGEQNYLAGGIWDLQVFGFSKRERYTIKRRYFLNYIIISKAFINLLEISL